jgi:hypothetical protein
MCHGLGRFLKPSRGNVIANVSVPWLFQEQAFEERSFRPDLIDLWPLNGLCGHKSRVSIFRLNLSQAASRTEPSWFSSC